MFLFLTTVTFAQSGTVSGTVTDGSGMTLPGVNVMVKGSGAAVSTDIDGKYTVAAATGDTLVFSFIGYASQEVAVTGSTLNVQLKEDTTQLDEVVVVGYGTQRKKDITGAVATISGEKFENRPTNQLSNLIQGQTAGVQVSSVGGKPGGGFNIRIRGTSSIGASSEPIYVIDGVVTTDTRSLNPADIETISILKDASSAAIYGSQGANGVVLITTKQGKSEKPVISYETYVGFQSVWKKMDVLNAAQYRDLMTEMGYNTDWTQYTADTNWQDEVFRTGVSNSHQLSVSGKSNNTSYYLSGNFLKQDGAVRSSEMDRKSFKASVTQQATSWLKLGTNVNYVDYHDVDVTDNTATNSGGVILGVLNTPQNIGIFRDNGTYTSNPFQDWENPISSTDAAQRGYRNQRLFGNVFTEIEFIKGLTFRSNLGIDFSNATSDYFLDPYTTSYGRAMKGIGRYQTWLTNYHIWDNTINYKLVLDKHNIEAVAGTVYQERMWENSSIERRNFAGAGVTTPNGGAQIVTADATKSKKINESFLARINYAFDDKYLLTANFRADGSSSFGPNEKWGYFPSFSAGWRISQEQFMQGIEAISDLKFRAGWGLVGNDNTGTYAWAGGVALGSNYPIGGAAQPGNYPSSIQNEDLKWEATEQTNFGIDLALFKNRIRISADYYRKLSHDLLLPMQLPRTSGFSSAIVNAGSVKNVGFEFNLSTVNFDGDFRWTTDFNISTNKNTVVDVLGGTLMYGGVAGRGDLIRVQAGQPLGQFYGYEWGGVDPATGDAYYIDANGQPTFTPGDADKKVIGDANPDFIYGFTNNFSYKNVYLNVFFQGVQGNDMFNASRIDTESMIDAKNQTTAVLDRWQQPGDVTDIPRSLQGDIRNSRLSSRYVEDGSYLRLKAITLGYTFPKNLTDRLSLASLSIYGTGENLLTFTKYSGFDPEVNFGGTSNTNIGIDYGTYPQTRNIIFGIKASL